MKTITLNGRKLLYKDVQAIFREKVRLRIDGAALRRVVKSRAVLERKLAKGETIYGVNTGFGLLADRKIEPRDIERLQEKLLLSHTSGLGRPVQETGLLLVLKANCLLGGASGVTPALVKRLVEMFNRGDRPLIHEQGSVGASGDLAPLAELGVAMLRGKPPYKFKAKEALSLINGTQLSCAILGRVLVETDELLRLADVAGAMSLEALRGSIRPFDRRFHQVRPHPGQSDCAANIRKLLRKSQILESHRDCQKVQDAYSLRCMPQVHGAVRDVFTYARSVFALEINSITDNPLIFENGDIVSGGNFHGQPVAIAADALATALVSLANISERRIDRMTNPNLSELPAFLVNKPGLNCGYMMVQVAAAALAAECRADCMPASVQSIPTGGSKEDHVPMAPLAARKCGRILENARAVVGLEILCASQGIDFLKPLKPGRGVQVAWRRVRKTIPFMAKDRFIRPEVQKVASAEFLRGVLAAVEKDVGGLA